VVKGLSDIGIRLTKPRATFYVWAPVPKGKDNAKEFCFKVLDKVAVWMIPGSMYGPHGEGFFRIALTHPTDRLAEAMDRLRDFMR